MRGQITVNEFSSDSCMSGSGFHIPLKGFEIQLDLPTPTGQYTIPLECLQPGYRHVPLQSLTGEELPHAKLFVHVALTNRRGGGKPHKRGLSVRKARKGRDYTALRDLGVRAVDDVFKMAAPQLREATDLRENMQVRQVNAPRTDDIDIFNWDYI